MARTHFNGVIWNTKPPVYIDNVQWQCRDCKDIMYSEDYIIHTAFLHNTLFEISQDRGFDLIREIRRALKSETERAERGRKVLAEDKLKTGRNELPNRQRSLSIEIENDHQILESSTEGKKMQQKINSYKPLTTKEVQVLTRKIPLRQATSEEKEDMTKAVSKLHTKLHLLYTLGVENVPGSYKYTRISMLSNFNKLYGNKSAIEGKNLE